MREPAMAPNPADGWTPPLPVDYRHRVKDIRYHRGRNLYAEDEKDLRLEYRFWHPFHYDFYDSILYRKFLKKKEPPVLQVKCIDAYSLGKYKEPELQQMIRDIQSMGLSYLLEFRKNWNNELICQFYASYHHERDQTGAVDIIHWTTEGKHYKVDFVNFSRLLGLGHSDRTATELTEYEDLALEEYQHMYLEGHRADGQTTFLKPYYYVLNNILRQILYPKVGDSTFLRDDSQKVLQRFGDEFQKFSISRYIWNKIHDATEDPVKHLPYAPYIMHIIEHVSDIRFPYDSKHKLLKISNKTSIIAARELREKAEAAQGKGKGVSGSRSRHGASTPAAAARSSSAEPLSSSSSGKKPNKFKFLMIYMFG